MTCILLIKYTKIFRGKSGYFCFKQFYRNVIIHQWVFENPPFWLQSTLPMKISILKTFLRLFFKYITIQILKWCVCRVNDMSNTFFSYFSEDLLHHSNTSRQNRRKWGRKMCSANECKFINLHLKRIIWAGKPSINKQCFAVFSHLFFFSSKYSKK